MKTVIACLLALGLCSPLAATPIDQLRFEVEEVETPDAVFDQIYNAEILKTQEMMKTQLDQTLESADEGLVDINTIINYGVKIWQVVKENEPVVTQSHMYANALPAGLAGAYDLENSSPYQYKSFRVSARNLLGIQVYDVVLTLAHQYGGSYEGKGSYIASASIIPSDVNVLWGYTVDLSVKEVSTTNIGKKDSPVASLALELNFHVSTPLQKTTFRRLVEFLGNSATARMIR